jgi:hypothetical protein
MWSVNMHVTPQPNNYRISMVVRGSDYSPSIETCDDVTDVESIAAFNGRSRPPERVLQTT